MTAASDRRLEPRYPVHGPVVVRAQSGVFTAEIFDVSLNGALLSNPGLQQLHSGDQLEVEITLQDVPHVHARALVAHVHGDRFGIEFQDMPARDFDVFCGLVLMLAQQRRPSLLPSD